MDDRLPTDVGTTLKRLRRWTQMSIRDVAAKAGCSIAVVSKIELNQVSPTVRTLEKICHALDITLADFLRPFAPSEEKPIIIPVDRQGCPPAMSWSGAKLLRVLPDDKVNFTALLLRLEPGGRTSARSSLISHYQLCFVLLGEVALKNEDVSYPIRMGEGIYFNTHQSHEWINTGTELAEVLSVNPYHFTLFEQKDENLRWQLHSKREKRKKAPRADRPPPTR